MNPPNSLPSISEDAIIDLLNSAPQSIFSEKELIRHFDLYKRRELTDFADLLDDMIATNRIIYVQGKVGGFASLASARIIEGKIDFAQARKAFVVVDEEPNDIVVYPEDLMGALHADKVRVRVMPAAEGQQPRGQVVEVLDRARTEFTGLLQVMGNKAWVEPDMRRMHSEIKLTNVPQGFQSGHKVLVRVTDFGKGDRPRIMGELIESFGEAGTHKAQMQGIMVEFNLPLHYPDEPQKEAERIEAGITKEEVARRRDFRDVTTFTIDPIDAKDFDDALSIRKTEDGLWEVGVHIADVTHYVKEGTALEREAKQRATSVYLVDRVIPMLPERLSNELCSLRPHEDKLTYAAVFTMDDKAKVSNVWIGRTVIHSNRRFSYEQAQEILEGAEGDFKDELLTLNQLAHKLRDERFRKGAISFELPEVRFELDPEGKPLRVVAKVRKDAHKLVEDWMLLANKYVAEFVFDKVKGKRKLPMVYRVHESPDPDKMADLSKFVSRFGFQFNVASGNVSKELNKLNQSLINKPEELVINQYAVRSMQKARYTVEALGHFGLGYKHYSHFTSPIRRYPDMMAHRLLTRYLRTDEPAETNRLEAQCKHSSEMEKKAADAERASIKYKQVEFMLDRIGEEFDGVVSGLTEWGLYIEIKETACEGMLRLRDLKDDHYVHDPTTQTITGMRRGRRFQFGDKVRVRMAEGNLVKRTIDLELADSAPTSPGGRSSGSGRSSSGRGGSSRGSASRGQSGRGGEQSTASSGERSSGRRQAASPTGSPQGSRSMGQAIKETGEKKQSQRRKR